MGGWVQGSQFHVWSHDSVFRFLLDSATVFPPSHPFTNSCLKFIEVYQCLQWVKFFLLLTPNISYFMPSKDRNVNKLLFHCRVADKWLSVCENIYLIRIHSNYYQGSYRVQMYCFEFEHQVNTSGRTN